MCFLIGMKHIRTFQLAIPDGTEGGIARKGGIEGRTTRFFPGQMQIADPMVHAGFIWGLKMNNHYNA